MAERRMISDTERREVARRLREYASWDGEEDCLVDCADWGERVLNLLGCGDTEGECYAALADLIEPSEPKVKCVAEVKVDGERLEELAHDAAVELTGIDRDALLELADEMEIDGAGALDDEDWCKPLLVEYANRIREACGPASLTP